MDITAKNCTIAAGVMCVLGKTKESSRLGLDGKQLATRKNPHVIDVGFGLDITLS
jgi:hypothetical protein